MNIDNKKDYIIIIAIAAIIAIFGLLIAEDRPQLQTVMPEHETILEDEDFRIETAAGELMVGSSNLDEVIKVFPNGKTLGMSAIYQVEGMDCLLTFAKKEDVLQQMHLSTPEITTARGIKVGDSFSQAVEKYGPDYASVGNPDKPKDFDAVYGGENNIVFQVRNNIITKIVLQKE